MNVGLKLISLNVLDSFITCQVFEDVWGYLLLNM